MSKSIFHDQLPYVQTLEHAEMIVRMVSTLYRVTLITGPLAENGFYRLDFSKDSKLTNIQRAEIMGYARGVAHTLFKS